MRIGRWLRITVIGIGLAVGIKLAVQLYLRRWTHITPPQVSALLDNPVRRRYRDFERTLAPLEPWRGARVLEIGGGIGAMTLSLAERVGEHGMICSIEIQAPMLQQQARRVRTLGAQTVHLHQADAMQLPFADGVFDRAVMVAVLPMLPNKARGLAEARRVLKPDGHLLISEELPEPEYVPLSVTRRWCRQAGFEEVAIDRARWFYTLVVRSHPTSARP